MAGRATMPGFQQMAMVSPENGVTHYYRVSGTWRRLRDREAGPGEATDQHGEAACSPRVRLLSGRQGPLRGGPGNRPGPHAGDADHPCRGAGEPGVFGAGGAVLGGGGGDPAVSGYWDGAAVGEQCA